ncbi:MAG TPA: glycosyltransferase family 1 protein [Thermoanaerobaculia bacterium]|nr:glycosyltransferase family 1 protein [Thermoanaerobaculia bacterium]
MTAVVQIVPHLPPPPEGVGSYALALADALRNRRGIESAFVSAAALPARTPEDLRDALGTAAVALLHYAGYGYHPRGCPGWLVEGLEGWNGRLVTAFHEVWATGLPWRSSFWLSPRQRSLAGRLARRSDGLVTSMALYRRRLLRHAPGRETAVLPVFSTVGEPAEVPPLGERAPRLVLFGGPGVRGRAYRYLGAAIARTCETLGLREIWDIGPAAAETPERIAGRPVRRLGPLPAAEVSRALLAATAGFVSYPASFLAKSTIFAAYCSHGMLPASAWPRPRRQVEPPPPFWQPAAADRHDPQEVADRARDWYRSHTLERSADIYGRLLLA